MIGKIYEWLINVIWTIPEGIIQGIIIGFVGFVFRRIFNKFSEKTKILNKFIENIANRIIKISNDKLEIPRNLRITKSPKYKCNKFQKTIIIKINNRSSSSGDNVMEYLIIVMMSCVLAITLFIKFIDYIAILFKVISIIPLIICIILLFSIIITNKVQSITLKFLIYSIPISSLTLYYGVNLIDIAKNMSPQLANGKIIYSIYILLGLIMAIVEQSIVYIFLYRVFVVYLESKKILWKWILKSIHKTERLESNCTLIIMITVFSILSYLLTSGIMYDYISKLI